ncbi:unnamed protein product, partial [Brassica rapa subsp. narinosa]
FLYSYSYIPAQLRHVLLHINHQKYCFPLRIQPPSLHRIQKLFLPRLLEPTNELLHHNRASLRRCASYHHRYRQPLLHRVQGSNPSNYLILERRLARTSEPHRRKSCALFSSTPS